MSIIKNIPLLTGKGKKGGLYILGDSENTNKFYCNRSIDLVNRLNNSYLVFPDGYYIYGIILSSVKGDKKARLDETKKLESCFYSIINEIKTQNDMYNIELPLDELNSVIHMFEHKNYDVMYKYHCKINTFIIEGFIINIEKTKKGNNTCKEDYEIEEAMKSIKISNNNDDLYVILE